MCSAPPRQQHPILWVDDVVPKMSLLAAGTNLCAQLPLSLRITANHSFSTGSNYLLAKSPPKHTAVAKQANCSPIQTQQDGTRSILSTSPSMWTSPKHSGHPSLR